MKKYFVFGDVHNYFDELMNGLVLDCGFDINDPNHIIISLGDAFDRGSQAHRVLNFLVRTVPKERRILIRGNHEDLFMEAVRNGGCYHPMDRSNGLHKTWGKLNALGLLPLWKEYYNETVNFALIDNYIFVHGWVPDEVSHITDLYFLMPTRVWEQARWSYSPDKYKTSPLRDCTIVVGHIRSQDFHGYADNRLFISDFNENGLRVIALDTCTALTRKVNVWTIESDSEVEIG